MIVLSVLAVAVGVLLLVPAAVYFVEVCLAVLRGLGSELEETDDLPRTDVVIPAHDEEEIIGETVRHVVGRLHANARLFVVADNCSDKTAEQAELAGAAVWVRDDPERVGKGHAITFAVEQLTEGPPEVVVLVDADCRLSKGFIERICRVCARYRRPIQARYTFGAPEGAGMLARISALACLIRNAVRPAGLAHLGMPCHLTGSGMAFPWQQLRDAPDQQGNLVEDLSLGLDLAIAGHEPLLHPGIEVETDLPQTRRAARSQRTRWEQGQIATFLAYAPRLFAEGVRARRASLIALALDIAVPPLALLVALLAGFLLLSAVGVIFFGLSPIAAALPFLSLLLVATATILAWARFGRDTVDLLTLLLVPFYVAWKIPVYVAMLIGKRQRIWNRTDRGSD